MRLYLQRVCSGVTSRLTLVNRVVVYSIRFGTAVRENRALFKRSGECGMEIRMPARLVCIRAYGNDPPGSFKWIESPSENFASLAISSRCGALQTILFGHNAQSRI